MRALSAIAAIVLAFAAATPALAQRNFDPRAYQRQIHGERTQILVLGSPHLSGAPDYQLRVACRDTAELDRLLRHLKREGGVSETDTRVVLRSAFTRGAP